MPHGETPGGEDSRPIRYLSLFSGIEAASVAWKPLGWECVGVAEIDPFPCAVLEHRFPEVPNLGDITKITEDQIKALGQIDLIVGGFPCQDLSTSGKRKGMRKNETRSGLFYDAIRIVWAAREHSKLRWLLLENVPGIYSSRGGADFASMVNEILGTGFSVPVEGWKNAGVASGPNGLLEWRTLDAKFFGVPQRRRRMFALADFGDWANRPPVLFERESLLADITPGREAGEGVARGPEEGAARDSSRDTGQMSRAVAIPINMQAAAKNGKKSPNGTGIGNDGDPAPTLGANDIHAVAFSFGDGGESEDGVESPATCQGLQIRRFTPLECEKLMGLRDDYTLVPFRGKPAADGPRYRALGNSMAVPCMSFMGRLIQIVECLVRAASKAA